jgi:hypothetical protein
MNDEQNTPEQWLHTEDRVCFEQRVARLEWLTSQAPRGEIWAFPGGWLDRQLFEQARYCFVYGQFLGTAILGFAYVERTLASMFYASGRNNLQRATSEKLFREALAEGWLDEQEFEIVDKVRRLRNPLVHFHKPLHDDLPESRAMQEERGPYDVIESDARRILEVASRLVELNAVG